MSTEEQVETKNVVELDNSQYIAKLNTYNAKHPLQDEWTFWFKVPTNHESDSWSDATKQIYKFNTLEEFWGLQAALPSVETLTTDYMFFKKDIKPEWEDKANEHGGKWVVSLGCSELGLDVINKFWGRVMFSIIGNNFINSDHINGFYISFKKFYFKLQVWTDSIDRDIVLPIGEKIKELLVNSEFGMHEESQMRKNNTFNPTRFTNKNPLYSQLHNENEEKPYKKSFSKSSVAVDQTRIVFNNHERKEGNVEIVINLLDKVDPPAGEQTLSAQE